MDVSIEAGALYFGSSHATLVKRDTVAGVEVSEGREFARGQTASFPFSLPVPGDLGSTVATPHALVEWRLKAIVDRRMRGDAELAAPVTVVLAHTAGE